MKFPVGLRVLVGFCRHFFLIFYSSLLFPIHRWTVKQPALGGWGRGEWISVLRGNYLVRFFFFSFFGVGIAFL